MQTKNLIAAMAAGVLGGCIANSAPEWQSASEITVDVHTEGVVYTALATDADGDQVHYRVENELPSGWAFDTETGELTAAPRQTADAPRNAIIHLVAFDDYRGTSPLILTVTFDYLSASARHIDFPPANSAINLHNNERVTLLLANEPNQHGSAITGITLENSQGDKHVLSLRADQDYWQSSIALGNGEHVFSGVIDFADGSHAPISQYPIRVNDNRLLGDATAGQITSGHQISEDGKVVYFLSETDLVAQSLQTGECTVIWSFNDPFANYYFGVQAGEQKISVLVQHQPLYKLSSPAMGAVIGGGGSNDFSIYEIDLAAQTMTKTGVANEPALEYGPFVMEYDATHHRFLATVFQAGVGGTGVGESGMPNEEQVTATLGSNAIFEIDPVTGVSQLFVAIPELDISPVIDQQGASDTPPNSETPVIAPIYAADGDDNTFTAFMYGQDLLYVGKVNDDSIVSLGEHTGIDRQHLVLAADTLADNRVGAVSTGLAYNILADQGGLYSTFYVFEDGVAQFKTDCNTRDSQLFNWQSPEVQLYPNGCINGIAYDLTVLPARDIAMVTAINAVNLPLTLIPDDIYGFNLMFNGDKNAIPTVMQSVQAISLITGQIVTLYNGY